MKDRKNRNEGSLSVQVAQKRFIELADIDNRIVKLLVSRAELLHKEGAWRRSRRKSQVDPGLEKNLRRSWEDSCQTYGLDAQLSRQLFTLLNQFAFEGATRPEEGETNEGYKLAPRKEKAQARIAGPQSMRLTRYYMAMAAACGQRVEFPGAMLNAPVKDFAKGLKQAGAKVTWDDNGFLFDDSEPLSMENALAFTGNEPMNFYLLLAFALGGAGRCKFTGQPALQLMDLNPFNKLVLPLGARLVSLNPNNPGLPARLECGGAMDEEIQFPKDMDPEMAGALTLAAWAYPGGLTITNLKGEAAERAADAISVLKACGIEAEIDGKVARISDGVPEMPEVPEIPLDEELAGFLLALPAFCGGTITVEGVWGSSKAQKSVFKQLTDMGLSIEEQDGLIIASEYERNRPEVLELGQRTAFYPLALALGIRMGDAKLVGEAPEEALSLLDRLGAEYEEDEDGLTLINSKLDWDGLWAAPTPYWMLACALISWVQPGITLSNHGELTALWPQFWNFFNTLPTGKMRARPAKKEKDNGRRRIKIKS